jgi:hypothetical protein
MLRLASLLLTASLATGCITGIDQKPYDIHIGPRIDPDDQAVLIVATLLVAIASAGVYVIADNAR